MTEKKPELKPAIKSFPGQDRKSSRGPRMARRRAPREQDEFDQQLIDLARVTRVMAGGKRMRFRACVVIGDRKGRVGWGLAKGADVAIAMQKAVARAKKDVINVSMIDGTIPHEVKIKFKAARLMLRPAKKGRGLIAGGVVRTILNLAGVKDIVSKMHGSNNKVNNVAATFVALNSLRRVDKKNDKTKSEKDKKVDEKKVEKDVKKSVIKKSK